MSALKSAAARTNGTKSRGPITPQGKARSASNLSTHGIFKSPYTLRNENDPVFLQLEGEFNEEWDPQGPTETVLVEQMILCQWRLRRIWAAETAGIAMQMDEDAAELAETYGEFDEAPRRRVEAPRPDAALRPQPEPPGRSRPRPPARVAA